MSKTAGLIFAKYPTAGSVKTRLVPPLSPDDAVALHTACLKVTCERLQAIDLLDVKLVVTPDDRANDLLNLLGKPIHEAWPQGDGDLGRRMQRATERAFAENVDGVLLFGADSPTLPAGVLVRALRDLVSADGVVGPCFDGGYYLLGLRRPCPLLFQDIEWGSDMVLEQTRRQASRAGISLTELPEWYDLDRPADLSRAAKDLANMTSDSSEDMIALRQLIQRFVGS